MQHWNHRILVVGSNPWGLLPKTQDHILRYHNVHILDHAEGGKQYHPIDQIQNHAQVSTRYT